MALFSFMKEKERQAISIEVATDLIHAVTLNTHYPFVLEGVGKIDDPKMLKRLQFVGIYAKKRELEELGEEVIANDIIVKGKRILLFQEDDGV